MRNNKGELLPEASEGLYITIVLHHGKSRRVPMEPHTSEDEAIEQALGQLTEPRVVGVILRDFDHNDIFVEMKKGETRTSDLRARHVGSRNID